jgi:uncharacterized paraquat-inducible protein A
MKLTGKITCDKPPCKFKQEVDDIGAHMNDNCPRCGKPLMDEVDKQAFATLLALHKAGVISQRPGAFGENGVEMTIKTAEIPR